MFFLGAVVGGGVALTATVLYYASQDGPQRGLDMRRAKAPPGAGQWYMLGYKEEGPRARLGLVDGPYDTRQEAAARAERETAFYPKVRRLTPAQLDRL